MLDIEQIVYSRITALFSGDVKAKFPDLNFTLIDKEPTDAKFPTIYVHLLNSPETGVNLENNNINGMLATFQIRVTDNKKQGNAKKCIDEITKVMKGMRFTTVGMPQSSNPSVDKFVYVARFRRAIGADDLL